ncbi:alpha/beta hydrolase [Rubrivirga sp. S365]|uniref:alpha/beta hydrolase n=1 Tax=Rubrivirga sp. S365 TaxID=3076080 RepID=UPI0028C8CB64|nr:alpha/beta hydrolase [Rubrivirga sp. S365]MDT7858377.1 alpha/beta hydrolase [Rubrivirga sp. S365]
MPAPFDGPVTFADVQARIEAVDLGESPDEMRAAFARLMRGDDAGEPVPDAATETWGGVDALRLGEADGNEVAVWFHGGGYVFGRPETHARPAAAFAQALGVPVVLPRYRLAPEHPWPAQRDDALAAVRALQDAGRRVVLAGDSAGGHLALVTALTLAGEGRPVGALALFSPNTDRTGLSGTRQANTPRDAMNADDDDRQLAEMTFRDRPNDDPEVSPLLADLGRLPRTHVEVGGREVLLGDALRLAERACAAGADLSLHLTAGAFHMWQLWTPWLPAADASIRRAAAALAGRH